MTSITCGKAFLFDYRGDLTLKVGTRGPKGQEIPEAIVCSRSLARWSPIFSAMLFGKFSESRPANGDSWSVYLPDDDFQPLFILLSIAHGHFASIPEILTLNELYQFLILTDKYDMTKVLHPWVPSWLQPYERIVSISGNKVLLCVAWELGNEPTFRTLATDLLLNSNANKNSQLMDKDGVLLDTYRYLEPPGVLSRVNFIEVVEVLFLTRVYSKHNRNSSRTLAGDTHRPSRKDKGDAQEASLQQKLAGLLASYSQRV
ncbi:hypothetical protein CCHL11_00194 [Colletotrichum chlorophyti]|uniref:BTB domain-containing protein n=1 Tax=Colletotrichum chlorophyti TaxID=708187 RepID=A0A1Q8RV93_9PEZI|nr:hypothetical protein CCHL11_00194 [Colletotrichum chlorophyti]